MLYRERARWFVAFQSWFPLSLKKFPIYGSSQKPRPTWKLPEGLKNIVLQSDKEFARFLLTHIDTLFTINCYKFHSPWKHRRFWGHHWICLHWSHQRSVYAGNSKSVWANHWPLPNKLLSVRMGWKNAPSQTILFYIYIYISFDEVLYFFWGGSWGGYNVIHGRREKLLGTTLGIMALPTLLFFDVWNISKQLCV